MIFFLCEFTQGKESFKSVKERRARVALPRHYRLVVWSMDTVSCRRQHGTIVRVLFYANTLVASREAEKFGYTVILKRIMNVR